MSKLYNKSPLNYIGNKYRLLPQLEKIFPNNINNFVDLFCGGLDIAINTSANNIYCNDINYHLIDIFNEFKKYETKQLIEYIENKIIEYNLSKTNKLGYINLRKVYNTSKNPIDLFILSCYSFNHQIRFNNKQEFNTPFGQNRSSFNNNIKENLIVFHKKIKNINFHSCDFRQFDLSFLKENDFVYIDPPYLISLATYNDGKRGFSGWTQQDDEDLFNLLDELDKKNIKFALSNVIVHKGLENNKLRKWKEKYNTHYINCNYNNSNYHLKNKNNETIEIVVTNY